MSRCWAHNTNKVRCELDAGHDDLHRFSISWSDSECYEPGKNITTEPVALPRNLMPPLPPPTPPVPVAEVKCVACSHRHRAGECKCGCKEFVG
jgi:hypothetical protein